MIVLDTHVLVWWVHGDKNLTETQVRIITENEIDEIGISAITCWEIAKLVEYGRLELPCPIEEWFEQALSYPGRSYSRINPGDSNRIYAVAW